MAPDEKFLEPGTCHICVGVLETLVESKSESSLALNAGDLTPGYLMRSLPTLLVQLVLEDEVGLQGTLSFSLVIP